MKKVSRVLALLGAAVMLMGVCTACNGGTGSSSADPSRLPISENASRVYPEKYLTFLISTFGSPSKYTLPDDSLLP